jgi:prepilin-type processing-associated H-X9-DG protein
LYCPADVDRTYATNFVDITDANISYFFSLDATNIYPQMILTGDANLAVDGVHVKPGILIVSTNNTIAWTKKRHQGYGNIGLVGGSVLQVTSEGLNSGIVGTPGTPTNHITPRLVIP